jgi:predicted SAM-dependent methyltransferase
VSARPARHELVYLSPAGAVPANTETMMSPVQDLQHRLKVYPLIYDAARLSYRAFETLRITYFVWRRPTVIKDYFANNRIRRLNLGAGPTGLKGWLNCDLQHRKTENTYIYLDVCGRFPFADESFHYIFTEHLIEHLSLEEGERFLGECFRCLMPGGRIRIATPDLGRLIAGYQTSSAAWQLYADEVLNRFFPKVKTRTSAAAINNIMSNFGHRFVYDESTLRLLLANCAFRDVVRQPVGLSSDPELCRIEIHGLAIGAEMNDYETMVLEAVRPASNDALGEPTREGAPQKFAEPAIQL